MHKPTRNTQPDAATLGIPQSHTRDTSFTSPQGFEAGSSLGVENLFNPGPLPYRAPTLAPRLPWLGLSCPKMETLHTPESTDRPWLAVSSSKAEERKGFSLPGSLSKTSGRRGGLDWPAGLLGWALGRGPPALVSSPCRMWRAAERLSGKGGDGARAPALGAAHLHRPPGWAAWLPPLVLLPASHASPATDGQLFRSVEGQAASDEEEEGEEKWQKEWRSLAEVTNLLAGLSSCKSGYVCCAGGGGGVQDQRWRPRAPSKSLNLGT